VKWKQIALVFTTLSLFVVPRAWNQSGNAEQQIKGVSDQISVAMLKADTDSLEKLLADDYTAIRTGGVFFNKAQEIEYVKSGALKYETNDVQDLKVRIYGRTAVTTIQRNARREAIQWHQPCHSGLGKAERQLEVRFVSDNANAISEQ
jgi:hypothetical protein